MTDQKSKRLHGCPKMPASFVEVVDKFTNLEAPPPMPKTSFARPLGGLLLAGLIAVSLSIAAGGAPVAGIPTHEKIIKAYFAGWENKDWDQIASQLAEDFTFTSPTPDDHLSIAQFKAKCWNQAGHIRRFEFPQIAGNEHAAFAIVHVITTDDRIIRNVEYFTFRDGRIAAIEVFFGGTGQGFPTNQK